MKQYSVLGVAEITVGKIIILFWCGYCLVCLSILLYFRRLYPLRPSASELAWGIGANQKWQNILNELLHGAWSQ